MFSKNIDKEEVKWGFRLFLLCDVKFQKNFIFKEGSYDFIPCNTWGKWEEGIVKLDLEEKTKDILKWYLMS